MKRRRFVWWVGALAVAGCTASPPAFEVRLRMSPTPALVGPTRLIVDVVDVEGNPVAGLAVSVEGVSDERDRRTTTRSVATDEGSGRYVVPDFDLDVRGAWTISVTVADGSGVSLTRAFPIAVYGRS